jgi:hypothetical protein
MRIIVLPSRRELMATKEGRKEVLGREHRKVAKKRKAEESLLPREEDVIPVL